MSHIDNFGEFMTEVVNRADKISIEKSGRALSDKYDAPSTILKMIKAISNTGWPAFSALCDILNNSSYFAFAAALAAFLISNTGLAVAGALVYWGGKDSLKLLYNNRALVRDVKAIGDKYENSYDNCSTQDEQNRLIDMAADDFYAIRSNSKID